MGTETNRCRVRLRSTSVTLRATTTSNLNKNYLRKPQLRLTSLIGAYGPADWSAQRLSTKAKLALGGLQSGTRYESRVAAIGAAGQSAWSDPVPMFAP